MPEFQSPDPENSQNTTPINPSSESIENLVQPERPSKTVSPKLEFLNAGLRCDWPHIAPALNDAITFSERTPGVEPLQLADMYVTAGLHYAGASNFELSAQFQKKCKDVLPDEWSSDPMLEFKLELLNAFIVDSKADKMAACVCLVQHLPQISSWATANPTASEADLIFISNCYLRTAKIYEASGNTMVASAFYLTAQEFSELHLGFGHLSTNFIRINHANWLISEYDVEEARELLIDAKNSIELAGEQNTMLYVQTYDLLAQCCLNSTPENFRQASRYFGAAIKRLLTIPDFDANTLVNYALYKTGIDSQINRPKRVESTILKLLEATKGTHAEDLINNHLELKQRLALAQFRMGKYSEAHASSRKLFELLESSPHSLTECGLDAAWMHYDYCKKLGLNDEAFEAATRMCCIAQLIYPGITEASILADSYTCLATTAFELGRYSESMIAAVNGLDTINHSRHRELTNESQLCEILASISLLRGDTQNAVKFFEAYNTVQRDIDSDQGRNIEPNQTHGYSGIAAAYVRMEDPTPEQLQLAMEYTFKIQEILEPLAESVPEDERQDPEFIRISRALTVVDSLTAQILFKCGSVDQAEKLFVKAHKGFMEFDGDISGAIATCDSFLGQICMERKDWNLAISHFVTAAKMFELLQIRGEIPMRNMEKAAETLCELGQTDDAKMVLEEVIPARAYLVGLPALDFENTFRVNTRK